MKSKIGDWLLCSLTAAVLTMSLAPDAMSQQPVDAIEGAVRDPQAI